ncbi:MAG: DUF4331 family protein [Myxococcota bacterium]|nr:DUF4331 family protein [Myxococcota bacterium]
MQFIKPNLTVVCLAFGLGAWGCADSDRRATGGFPGVSGGVTTVPSTSGMAMTGGQSNQGGDRAQGGDTAKGGDTATGGTTSGGTAAVSGVGGRTTTGGTATILGGATGGTTGGQSVENTGGDAGGEVVIEPMAPVIDVAALNAGDALSVTVVATLEGCPASIVAVSDKAKTANTAYIFAGPTGIGVIDALSGDALTDDLINLVTQIKGLYSDDIDARIEAYLTDSATQNAGGATKMQAAGVTICGDKDGGHIMGTLSADCAVDLTDGPVSRAHGGVSYTHHQMNLTDTRKKMAIHVPDCGTLALGDIMSKDVHLNLGDGALAGINAWSAILQELTGEGGLIEMGMPTVVLAGEGEPFPAAEADNIYMNMSAYLAQALTLIGEANGAAVPDGNRDGHVDQLDRVAHITAGLATAYGTYASTQGNLATWPTIACPTFGPNADGQSVLMTKCGSEAAPAYAFRTDAADDYTRVDRMGMPGVSTALLSDMPAEGFASKQAYNTYGPEGDVMRRSLPAFINTLEGLHTALDDDLRAYRSMPHMGGAPAAGMAAGGTMAGGVPAGGAEGGDEQVLFPCSMIKPEPLGNPPCLTQEVQMGVRVADLIIPDTITITGEADQGFPFGRKLTDPVMDITLAVLLLDLTQNEPDALVGVLNPTENDVAYAPEFPYLAPAHAPAPDMGGMPGMGGMGTIDMGGSSGGSPVNGGSNEPTAGTNGGEAAGSTAGGDAAGSTAGGDAAGSTAGGDAAGSTAGGDVAGATAGGDTAGATTDTAGAATGGDTAGAPTDTAGATTGGMTITPGGNTGGGMN